MLSHAIGGLLPSAVAVALSPIPIVAVILMLGTPRARTNGPAFGLGWIIGLVVVSVIVLVVASGASDPNSSTSDGVNWVTLLLGVAFLGMARRQWKKRPKPGEPETMPKWMSAVDHFTPVRSLALGFGLSALNPKNLALTLAASGSIAQAGLSTGDTTIAVAVFVVIASATVVGSVVFFLVAPAAAERPLAAIEHFMARNNAVIMMVILVLLGAKLIGDGLGGALS